MSPSRYSAAAITLHWLLALLLAFQISLGWTLEGARTPELIERFAVHKAMGFTILALSLIRLAIRVMSPRPAPIEPGWTARLASGVHWLFYVILIGTPLTGWILVSTGKKIADTSFWGVFGIPPLPLGRALHAPAEQAHGLLAFMAVILFVLHIAGALRHQWLLGKPELQRMIPFARGKAVISAIGAIALIFVALTIGKTVSPNPPGPVESQD